MCFCSAAKTPLATTIDFNLGTKSGELIFSNGSYPKWLCYGPRSRTLDAGSSIPDPGSWILDPGFSTRKQFQRNLKPFRAISKPFRSEISNFNQKLTISKPLEPGIPDFEERPLLTRRSPEFLPKEMLNQLALELYGT